MDDGLPPIEDGSKMLSVLSPDEILARTVARRESECEFRRGFWRGFRYAAEMVAEMGGPGGYGRPQEIANMMQRFVPVLQRWENGVWREDPVQDWCTPTMHFVPWKEVRQRVLERDGFCCVQCGSQYSLECHHIEPVAFGGIPKMDNLETLCETCHRAEHAP